VHKNREKAAIRTQAISLTVWRRKHLLAATIQDSNQTYHKQSTGSDLSRKNKLRVATKHALYCIQHTESA
jgi:hypothetical protein